MIKALSAATHAPHRKANSSVRGGSGSQRSTHKNAHTTRLTGSSAPNAPTATATIPIELVTCPRVMSPQIPKTTSRTTGASTLRR